MVTSLNLRSNSYLCPSENLIPQPLNDLFITCTTWRNKVQLTRRKHVTSMIDRRIRLIKLAGDAHALLKAG